MRRNRLFLLVGLCLWVAVQGAVLARLAAAEQPSHLQRAAVFLNAADYRQAVEACQAAVRETPSARTYVFLTYVYHALDGYL